MAVPPLHVALENALACWQAEHKRRTATSRRTGLNTSTMCLNDAACDGEPQSCPVSIAIATARLVRPVEPLPDIRQVVRIDPFAAVRDFYIDMAINPRAGDHNPQAVWSI